MTEAEAREAAKKEYATRYFQVNESEADYVEANWKRFTARVEVISFEMHGWANYNAGKDWVKTRKGWELHK